MKKLAVCRLALIVPVCSLLFQTAVFAAEPEPGEEEYEAARKAYAAKNYPLAEELFGKSVAAGCRTPKIFLLSGHTFLAEGQFERAVKTYELVIRNFKDSEEAKIAKASAEVARVKMKEPVHVVVAETPAKGAPAKPEIAAKPASPVVPGSTGLKDRIIVVAAQMGHPAVSGQSVKAAREAVASLPPHLRKLLDDGAATINIAPNMIDKWPESLDGLEKDEKEEAPTLAEVPGRIYGRDMYIYERPKVRGSTDLGKARSPFEIKHTVYNECFQVLDEIMVICKDPKLCAQYNEDKAAVPDSARDKLATFLKEDEWGAKETCSEIAAEILGAGDEFTSDLNRCFPKTKAWLKKKLGY